METILLTREQTEGRRMEGGRLLKVGTLSQAQISRQLGVSQAKESNRAKTIEAKVQQGSRTRKAAGSQLKLSKPQKLKCMLDRGASTYGCSKDRWTLDVGTCSQVDSTGI